MNKYFQLAVIFSFTVCSFAFSQLLYAWSTINGVGVCTAVTDQYHPQITSDGANGAIITWNDYRATTFNYNLGSDIYAQRIDSNGNPVWQIDGVGICTAGGNEIDQQITSDGAGGAIIMWDDYRDANAGDIYVQRVNSNGSTLWTNNGVAICTLANNQSVNGIIADGTGGAILTWADFRNGTTAQIYAQRVSSTGSTMWTNNGVRLCSVAWNQYFSLLVSDSAGGAIVVWQDNRQTSLNTDVYAQRIDSTGSILWQTNGIPICTATSTQYNPVITNDGGGGAVIAWEDNRNGSDAYDIYAQRVNSSGSTLWTQDGVVISNAASYQYYVTIAGDGSNGAIMTWQDYRVDGVDSNVYAQRVNSNGSTLWVSNGLAVCTVAQSQYYPEIVGDGTGGCLITWYDYRDELATGDIYAQRINSTGSTLWTLNGVAICTSTDDQKNPMIVNNGNNGAIITWYDNRHGNYDIYAQSVNGNGLVPINDWFNYAGVIRLPQQN